MQIRFSVYFCMLVKYPLYGHVIAFVVVSHIMIRFYLCILLYSFYRATVSAICPSLTVLFVSSSRYCSLLS